MFGDSKQHRLGLGLVVEAYGMPTRVEDYRILSHRSADRCCRK